MDKPFVYGLVGGFIGAIICLTWSEALGPHGYVLPLFLFNIGYLIARLDINDKGGGEKKPK